MVEDAKLAEKLYELMDHESWVNDAVERALEMPMIDTEKARRIRSDFRSIVVEKISELYSEEELAELTTFFSGDYGQAYLTKNKELKVGDTMMEIFKKHAESEHL